MTDPQVVSAVSRFFFLTHLDEKTAVNASSRVLARWRAQVGNEAGSPRSRGALIREIARYWQGLRGVPQSGQPILFSKSHWTLPADLNLGPWLEFRRTALAEEVFAVLTIGVMRFSEEVVAEGLGVSPGTVRHRLARGLRRLGQIELHPGPGL